MGTDIPAPDAGATQDLAPEFTAAEWVREIAAMVAVEARQPGEVDAKQIAAQLGITERIAFGRLEKAERHGTLTSRVIIEDGHRVRLWKRA